MHHGLLGALGAVALCLAPSRAMAAELSEPAPAAEAIEVRVETEGIDALTRVRIGAEIETRVKASLREAGHEVVERRGHGILEVFVVLSDAAMSDYSISYAFGSDGSWAQLVNRAPCPTCSEEQLVAEAVSLVPELDAALAGRGARAEGGTAGVETLDEEPNRGSRPGNQPLQLGPLGFTGVTFMVGGVVTGATGALLLSQPDVDWERLHPHDLGLGLAFAGGGVALLGTMALIIDRTVIRRCCRDWDLQIQPSLGLTQVGLSITGSF